MEPDSLGLKPGSTTYYVTWDRILNLFSAIKWKSLKVSTKEQNQNLGQWGLTQRVQSAGGDCASLQVDPFRVLEVALQVKNHEAELPQWESKPPRVHCRSSESRLNGIRHVKPVASSIQ